MSAVLEVTGPVEWVAITLPSPTAGHTVVPSVVDLVDRGLVRILDLVIVARDADGAVTATEFDELDADAPNPFDALDGDALGLLGSDDVESMGAGLRPGEAVLVVVWENLWATAFGVAVRAAGGALLAHDRIPHEDVAAALGAGSDEEVGT